jgi:hypothetical protein
MGECGSRRVRATCRQRFFSSAASRRGRAKLARKKNGFTEQPWRGNDTLILRSTFRAVETSYVVRDPEATGKVVSARVFVFADKLTAEQL